MRNMLKISMLRIMLPLPSLYPLSTRLARRFCRAGALKRADHALPSSFSSLLPTLTAAHCKVSTHYPLLSSPSSL